MEKIHKRLEHQLTGSSGKFTAYWGCVPCICWACTPQHKWLIFNRTVTPLEIFRWFPQIVFTLRPCGRPINVGFSNRFFCLSDKRFLNIIIKKKMEEDKS